MMAIAIWIILAVASAAIYVFTGVALIGAICLTVILLPPVTLLLAVIFSKGLAVSADMLSGVVKNRTEKCGFLVTNSSRFPFAKVILRVDVANQLTNDHARLDISASIPPRGENRMEFDIDSAHCGYLKMKCHRIYICDLFGILRLGRKVFIETGMTVLPQTFSPKIILDISHLVPEDSESYSPDRRGNDYTETFQIREYAEGDSLKQIHWKLSAKTGKLLVREASLPLSKSMMIFWDKYPGISPDADSIDAIAEVIVSLCQELSQMGYSYDLCWSEPSEQRCINEEVPDDEALPKVIPAMLKKGGKDDISGTERYLLTRGVPEYAKIIYVSNALPAGFEEFRKKSDVSVMLCGAENEDHLHGGEFFFTAEDYLNTMQDMEFAS